MGERKREDLSYTRHGLTRRTLLGGVVAVTGTAIAAACGPASAPGTTATGGPAATGAAATGVGPAPTVKAPVEVVFSHIWASKPDATGAQKAVAEQLVDQFNALGTSVKVKSRVDGNYFEVIQKTQAELAAGRPPAMNVTTWATLEFAESALGITSLEDIAPKAELDEVLSKFKPATVNLVKLGGKTKGLPFGLSTPAVFVNKDILKQAGVEMSALLKDWDSFRELAPKVKAVTGKPVIGAAVNWDWLTQSLIQNAGGRVLDDSGQPAMDSPEAVGALKVMADLTRDGLLSRATYAENGAAFTGGTLACDMTSIAAVGGLRKAVKFDMGTSTFPTYKSRPRKMSTGGSFIAVYARDPQQQAGAWQFLKFVASRQGQEVWAKQGYVNSSTHDIAQEPGLEPAYTQLAENDGATRETNWPGKRGAELQKVWDTYIQRIIAGDLSPEQGTKEAKAELLRILKQS